jgi:hypothetical protein
MSETSSAGPRLGDVATKLLFENDSVKVWEMRLEPGEASDPPSLSPILDRASSPR